MAVRGGAAAADGLPAQQPAVGRSTRIRSTPSPCSPPSVALPATDDRSRSRASPTPRASSSPRSEAAGLRVARDRPSARTRGPAAAEPGGGRPARQAAARARRSPSAADVGAASRSREFHETNDRSLWDGADDGLAAVEGRELRPVRPARRRGARLPAERGGDGEGAQAAPGRRVAAGRDVSRRRATRGGGAHRRPRAGRVPRRDPRDRLSHGPRLPRPARALPHQHGALPRLRRRGPAAEAACLGADEQPAVRLAGAALRRDQPELLHPRGLEVARARRRRPSTPSPSRPPASPVPTSASRSSPTATGVELGPLDDEERAAPASRDRRARRAAPGSSTDDDLERGLRRLHARRRPGGLPPGRARRASPSSADGSAAARSSSTTATDDTRHARGARRASRSTYGARARRSRSRPGTSTSAAAPARRARRRAADPADARRRSPTRGSARACRRSTASRTSSSALRGERDFSRFPPSRAAEQLAAVEEWLERDGGRGAPLHARFLHGKAYLFGTTRTPRGGAGHLGQPDRRRPLLATWSWGSSTTSPPSARRRDRAGSTSSGREATPFEDELRELLFPDPGRVDPARRLPAGAARAAPPQAEDPRPRDAARPGSSSRDFQRDGYERARAIARATAA